jgi:hypothetical protein
VKTVANAPHKLVRLAFALWALSGSLPVRAQEPETAAAPPSDATGEDELGFGDAPVAITAAAPAAITAEVSEDTSASSWHLSGSVGVQSALRLERQDADRLGKLRLVFAPRLEFGHAFAHSSTSLQLVLSARAEADFAYLLRPDAYDGPTMQLYGSQLIVGTSFVRVASSHFELAFGSQIVNFGQAEVLSLLDVVNPRDLREPLFADLEDLRLAVLMTRVGFSLDRLRAELILVHEPYFGLIAPPAGEFSPLRKLLLEIPGVGPVLAQHELYYQHVPGRDPTQFDAIQAHLRVSLRLSRADLSLQASSLLDSFGVPGLPTLDQLLQPRIDLPTYHPRYVLLGQAGALSLGAFLLRWELGCELERTLIVQRKGSLLPDWSSERLNTLRGLLGFTYVPSARTNLGIELLQSVVLDNPGRRAPGDHELLFPVEALQLALRLSHTFLRERATFTLVLLCIGVSEWNAFAGRAELSYAILDDLRLALGAVSYQPSSHFGPFYGFERNDRVYLNLRWSFASG